MIFRQNSATLLLSQPRSTLVDVDGFTLVESSSILVCSAMKRTQMQDLCTSGGQRECEKVGGLRITGLLTSSMPASPATERSSHSVRNGSGGKGGPWIRQLPPNLAPSVRLKSEYEP